MGFCMVKSVHSFLAQWKRAGLITPRSSDRDGEKLILFGRVLSYQFVCLAVLGSIQKLQGAGISLGFVEAAGSDESI